MNKPTHGESGSLLESYGVVGLMSLAVDVLITRLIFRHARVMRRPNEIRGRRWIVLGANFTSGRGLRIDALGSGTADGALIRIGRDVQINDFVHIGAVQSIDIGDRVLIASKVFISDHNHGSYGLNKVHTDPRIPPGKRPLSSAPVVIEDDVWIGEFVSVLPGVRIGKGSIIGTMSTVTKSIPPYCIAVGSPARVVKRYNFETNCWDRV